MMEIPLEDYERLLSENTKMRVELDGLRPNFLENTSKLGHICAAFGIPAWLPMGDLEAAILVRLTKEKANAVDARHWRDLHATPASRQ